MKLFLIFALSINSFATLSTNVQYEVRSTGNNNNGGGFIAGATGTDFSQQDAAQYTFSDLASSNGSSAPCTVTSASHNFVAADVGNLIHISAGTNWTANWYQIVSVAANAATLDRACGSVAALSAGTYFVGGGLLTIAQAITISQDTTANTQAGGAFSGTINIKAGTYTLTSALTPGVHFQNLYIGYNATHGDNGTPPLITTATNSTTLFSITSAYQIFDNLNLTNTAGTPSFGIDSENGNLAVRNCTFSGFSQGIRLAVGVADIISTEVKNSTGDGIAALTSGSVSVISSYIHNNTGNGVSSSTNTNLNIINSIISANTSNGVSSSATGQMCINSDIANNGAAGWTSGNSSTWIFTDCVIYGNTTFGIVGNAGNPFSVSRNNGYGSNTSGNLSNFTSAPNTLAANATFLGDVTGLSGPFISATNFALSAAGLSAIATQGYPGAFPGGLTTGTLAIGAVQNSSLNGGAGGNGLGTVIYVK